jgi:hypothetical protein
VQACSDASERVFLIRITSMSATSAAIIIKTNADVDDGCALWGNGCEGVVGCCWRITL